MGAPEFGELVGHVVEAMGLTMESARRSPEGIVLKTHDGFLLAFVSDPNELSLEIVRRWIGEVAHAPVKLVVLTPKRLPPALGAEVSATRATLVEGGRFSELVRGLALGSYLGEEPRPPPPRTATRLLPSARQLDEIMVRARNWLDWGVPALALRFYRQAAELKPEFSPARIGIGRSLFGLGLSDEADRAFDEVLRHYPEDTDARLGKAAVLGATGDPKGEIKVYRELLEADARRVDIRTQLVAALIAVNDWKAARGEVERIMAAAPEDPQIRFLYSVTLEKTGSLEEGQRERTRARTLGLDPERERTLCSHLGLPAPEFPPEPAGPRTPAIPRVEVVVSQLVTRRTPRPRPRKARPPRKTRKRRRSTSSRRKRK